MKDLPTGLPEGLCLAAVLPREDPHDVLCSLGGGGLAGLPKRARVGTSSLRRACQLRAARPDLLLEALRGNVDTRLRRLDEGRFDAVVLAAAGLLRLGHGPRISQRLPFEVCLPAIGQGAIGIEARADDLALLGRLACLHHAPTAAAVTAERAFLARLGGGCQTPIAAHAVLVAREAGLGEGAGKGEGGRLRLAAMVGQPDGSQLLRGEREAAMAEAAAMGEALADELIGRGADRILRETEAAAAAAPAGTAVF
jgi:hydroxymethylbilane synthase